MANTMPTLAGFGRTGIDCFRPVGDISSGFNAGRKLHATAEHIAMIPGLIEIGSVVDGQNMNNQLTYYASTGKYGRVALATVLPHIGEETPTDYLEGRMHEAGIATDDIIRVTGERAAASVVEVAEIGGDRCIFRRKGPVLRPHMTKEYLSRVIGKADVVAISSPKENDLTEEIVTLLDGKRYTINPSPDEMDTPHKRAHLRKIFGIQNPEVLSVNREEALQFYGLEEDVDIDPRELAEDMAGKYAKHVLLTDGINPMYWATDNHVYTQKVTPATPEEMAKGSTAGAGDRAMAVAGHGIFMGAHPKLILPRVTAQTRSAVTVRGATEDLRRFPRAA
jgi:sugar/nucleoside kinase (ribokinase family)